MPLQRRHFRPFKKTPIFVEDDHHDVLQHIFRAVGAKRIPPSGNVLLHFDSHPDLLLPEKLTSQEVLRPESLVEKLSIENWILPAVYMGIFDSVIWVCPPWSNQISPGVYKFQIGRKASNDEIAVTCLESYFLSEAISCSLDDLDLNSVKDVTLVVHKIQFDGDGARWDTIEPFLTDKPFVLDVDLDFFSTTNPFAGMYEKADFYNKLKRVYTFEAIPKDSSKQERVELSLLACEKRRLLLADLKKATSYLDSCPVANEPCDCNLEGLQELLLLRQDVASMYGADEAGGIDWKLVHDAGCTCDDTELPHHVSTATEINSLMERVNDCMTRLKVIPRFVTIARSSLDDYCPSHQVDAIQSDFLQLLVHFFSGRNILHEVLHGYLCCDTNKSGT